MVSRFRRSRPVGPPRFLALISAVATGVVLLRSAAAEQQQVFRCESEEDLDGSACRVDMLPDSALAEMVYERCLKMGRETAEAMCSRIAPMCSSPQSCVVMVVERLRHYESTARGPTMAKLASGFRLDSSTLINALFSHLCFLRSIIYWATGSK